MILYYYNFVIVIAIAIVIVIATVIIRSIIAIIVVVVVVVVCLSKLSSALSTLWVYLLYNITLVVRINHIAPASPKVHVIN